MGGAEIVIVNSIRFLFRCFAKKGELLLLAQVNIRSYKIILTLTSSTTYPSTWNHTPDWVQISRNLLKLSVCPVNGVPAYAIKISGVFPQETSSVNKRSKLLTSYMKLTNIGLCHEWQYNILRTFFKRKYLIGIR